MPYKNKADQALSAKRHYEANKAVVKVRALVHKHKTREHHQEVVLEHLAANPCVDCGESDPVVLEFDHRDPSEKKFNISEGVWCGFSLTKLLDEIGKCDVRCANCHRRKTAVQFGWYRSSAG